MANAAGWKPERIEARKEKPWLQACYDGETETEETAEVSSSSIWDSIKRYDDEIPFVDLSKEPEQSDFKAFLKGVPIGEDGDLIGLSARLKSFKSSAVAAIAASVVQDDEADTLGFQIRGDGVFLIFDTEQSTNEIQMQAKSIRRRLGVGETPERIKIIGLREKRTQDRIRIIKRTIEEHLPSGIVGIAIDGISDLQGSVNDEEQSADTICFLLVAAEIANAPLFAVIHLNHSDTTGKDGARGHLGKELERKAKATVYIEKDADHIGTIYCPLPRGKPIPKKEGQRIQYDEEKQMVVSLNQTQQEIRQEEKRHEWKATLREVERRTQMKAWTRKELISEILEVERIAKGADKKATGKTGNNRVNDMQRAGFLKVSQENGNLISTLSDGKNEVMEDSTSV